MNQEETKYSIVFFGTGPVAAQSLLLILDHFKVEAVVTKPVPKHHKDTFPVRELCQQHQLKIIEVSSKEELLLALQADELSNKAKVGLVVDFGLILTKEALDYFSLGMINSHFSLLPEWRGADPITFALLSGQKETGVSIMKIVEKMDEGPLLARESYKIREDLEINELTNDLVELNASMIKKYLPEYIKGNIEPKDQRGNLATYSRKLQKSDSVIDLCKPAKVLEREVRAYLGWPSSKYTLQLKDGSELELTITKAQVTTDQPEPARLILPTAQDNLEVLKLKLPGKNEMTTKEFLNGYKNRLNTPQNFN